MEIYKSEKRQRYLEKYSIGHLFSFPIEEFIEVHEYQRNEWMIQEGMRPDFLFYVIEGKASVLTQFCTKGYLQKEGRHYRIQQPKALYELAEKLLTN